MEENMEKVCRNCMHFEQGSFVCAHENIKCDSYKNEEYLYYIDEIIEESINNEKIGACINEGLKGKRIGKDRQKQIAEEIMIYLEGYITEMKEHICDNIGNYSENAENIYSEAYMIIDDPYEHTCSYWR